MEVVVEFSPLNVHDIVGDGCKVVLGLSEFSEDLFDCRSESLTFRVTDLNFL